MSTRAQATSWYSTLTSNSKTSILVASVLKIFPVTFDNDYYFTLNLLKKINITEVGEPNEESFFTHVYSENPLFSFQRYDNGSIDYGVVQSSDLLIINQLESIDQSILNIAQELLNTGKSVFLIPSKSNNIDDIQKISGKSVSLIEAPGKIALANPDVSNPFFREHIWRTRQQV